MPLVPGDRLGAHEITAVLGAGGMGEVYRARDTRLNRDVAIKVLPAQVSDDPDRLRRFEQEARAASALNHPNILTVYDIGMHERTRYLVSELLEGQTLSATIEGRPLPVRKAIDYAVQLARGLAAAHAKGIVHRDLKPENVFVTVDRRIKILDFGIAKLLPAFDQRDDAATVTAPLATTPGIVVGTAGYMAPEQVRGVATDERSDIFAFGAVFFEMLTGRMAFGRATTAETMSAVLVHDPLEPGGDAPALPPEVDRILRHCLEKSADERFQSARDLAFHLESIPLGQEPRAAVRRWSPLKIGFSVAGGLAAVGLIVAAVIRLSPSTAMREVARFTIDVPAGVQLRDSIALSPNGRTLVYSATDADGGRLYRRSVDMLESVPIRGSDSGATPFFSHDGTSVGFWVDRAVKWVPLEGGVAATIAEASGSAGGGAGAWLPDGTIVFPVAGRGLVTVPVTGGPVRDLTAIDRASGELEHNWPIPVPGVRAVSYTVHYGARDTQRVYAVSLDTGARTMLVEGNGARFLAGHIVFQRLGSLWAARFDPARLALTSSPVAVIDNVGIATDWSPIVAAAASGSLAYATGGQPYQPRTLVWVDTSGREQVIDAPARSWFWPQVSPDGKRIGFHDMSAVNMDIWIYDLERAALIRMTFDPRQDGYPVWTPDGQRIAFWSRQHGEAANLYVRSADLTGSDRRLTTSPHYQLPFSWASDGKLLVFQENTRDTGTDIGVVAVDGTPAPKMLLQTKADEGYPAVSPDGRWIAYSSNLSGRAEVYVQPFPDLGGRWQVSTQGGVAPVWHPNGNELYYRTNRAMMSVSVEAEGTTFEYGSPRRLFEASYVEDDGYGRNYALAPDGRFLMMKEPASPPLRMVVIVNWAAELDRLAPPR